MGTLWIPGAERIKPSTAGGTITSTAPPRVVWHTTEAPPGTDNMFATMIRVLTNKGAEPQVLYDPVTDRLGQFMPLNVSGRALKNDGATRTNRTGRVCIQIEVIGYSSKPFTDTWKPGPNFRALMAAIRSWGIPDAWPSGPPPRFVAVGTGGYNSPEDERSRSIWTTKGGHYGHSQIPGNDHGDPGGISITKLFGAAKAVTTPGDTPTPPKENDMQLSELVTYNHTLYGDKGTEGVWNKALHRKLDLLITGNADLRLALSQHEAEDDAQHAAVLAKLNEINQELADAPAPDPVPKA